ncbi:MAG TPA: mechanosensitive ion channel family protein [Rhizomicrobium sp.]|jgi:small-conductance mechanosensitive channel|nr:mechanosensitive ion channel family protein [Rhizomicrobium sp.]
MHIPAFITALLAWLPAWAIALAAFGVILAAAFVLQAVANRILGRAAFAWSPFLRAAFQRSRRLIRFAVIMFAVGVALPLVPFDPVVRDSIRKVMAAAVVVQLGWMILIAIDIATERYIGRFRLDTEDNLLARKAVTQVRVLVRAVNFLVVLLTAGFALMMFDSVRQYGVSLFASAGVAGIVAGLAARPVFSNLVAGMQLALAQPIRLDDAVVVNNEMGKVEEFTSTYVVIKLWDWRRMIVPLSYFFENPFVNLTRSNAELIGSVFFYVDYTLPVEALRAEFMRVVKQSRLWSGKVANLQVSDCKDTVMEVRALVSARSSGDAWDLRCEVREKLIAFIHDNYPGALPRQRSEVAFPSDASEEMLSHDRRRLGAAVSQ